MAITAVISCFGGIKAETEYMSAEDARYFLAFAYNADADHVTQAAFLSHLDARIIYILEKANIAAKTS